MFGRARHHRPAGGSWGRVTAPLAAAVATSLLLAAGCGDRQAAAPRIVAQAAEHEIEWFPGTVEEAFAHARARNLPVFLYWGAEWCPPCHEIKATVFRSREFIERSRLFVPVYLDGDAENAQAIGEQFAVLGYPTMIVFSPAGEEITRIPGGIDVQAYASVLDLAIGATRPAAATLARALDQGAALDAAECRLLAYYSWEQNPALLADRDRADAFGRLAGACPAGMEVERSMLYMAGLEAAVAAAQESPQEAALDPDLRREAVGRVLAVLGDESLARANLHALTIAGARITAAITDAGTARRAELEARFAEALRQLGNDPQLFTTERLYALVGRIRFARIDDAEAALPEALQREIRSTLARADAATTDPYERQTVINMASAVLEMAGMTAEAKALLLAELGRSKQPYYFMTGLADLERTAGNHEAAIAWLARGYEEARGPATRFQWGTYYVLGLIEMVPEDEDRIAAATLRVVGELAATRAFHQRPKAQLERMQGKLESWNADGVHAAAIARIRDGVRQVCAAIPDPDPARASCDGFLARA